MTFEISQTAYPEEEERMIDLELMAKKLTKAQDVLQVLEREEEKAFDEYTQARRRREYQQHKVGWLFDSALASLSKGGSDD